MCGIETLVHCRNVKPATTIEDKIEMPQKIKTELLYNPAISLLGVYKKELKAGSWRDTCTTPMLKAALVTIAKKKKQLNIDQDEWIFKNVAYIAKGILFSLWKEENSTIYYNMVESWNYYAKWNKSLTKRQALQDSALYKNNQIHRV